MTTPSAPLVIRAREILLRTNRIWGGIARVGTMVLGFTTVTLALGYLGPQSYGLWLVLSTIPGWVALLEFGIGPILRNRVAQLAAVGTSQDIQGSMGRALWFLSSVSMAGVAITLLTEQWVPWPRILALGATAPPDIAFTASVFLIFSLISLPFTVAGHLVVGLQRGYLLEVCQIISAACVVIGLVILKQFTQTGSFAAGVLVLGIIPQMVSVGFFFLVFLLPRYSAYRPIAQYHGQSGKSLLGRHQWPFFFQHVSSLVAPLGEGFIILHLLTPEAVAQAGIVQRWYLPIAMIQSVLMAPLHPAYADAMSRGDLEWTRRTLTRFSRRSWQFMGLAGLVLVFCQPWYVQIISKGQVEDDQWLGVFFCLRALQNVWGGGYATFLLAIGQVKRLAFYNWVGAFLYVPLAIALGTLWGSKGVVLGGVLAYTPVACSNWLQSNRSLHGSVAFPAREKTA